MDRSAAELTTTQGEDNGRTHAKPPVEWCRGRASAYRGQDEPRNRLPDLDQLKHQAKDLLRAAPRGRPLGIPGMETPPTEA